MSNYTLPSLATMAKLLGGEVRNGEVLCPGPGHSPADRSLAVKPDHTAPGGLLVHSFAGDDDLACKDYVFGKLGLPAFAPKKNGNGGGNAWTLVASYEYGDANGEPHTLVKKFLDENGHKRFAQYHRDGGEWVKGKPKGGKVPYHLPEMLAASPTTPIYFCEGEKCADAVAKLGFVTTSASEGASAKWADELTPYFKDRPVVILVDSDAPGRKHGRKVARALDGVAASIKLIDLYPDRDDGSDVADFLETDRSGAQLAKLAREAPIYDPSTSGGDTGDSDTITGSGDDEVLAELAALDRLQYARRRKDAAKRLGIGLTDLDKIVSEMRAGKEPTPPLYEHWTVERCGEPVDGESLLQEIVATVRRYVAMSDEQALVVALWIVLTWVHDEAAIHSPILLATSPQPNSGKTTLLKVVSFLARRGLSSVSITGPALFRSIEKWQPTFIIDEADTAFVNNDDLKEVVNSGWTRGETVIRCDPDTHEPRPYSTFCAKAIGMIGRKLPAATLSRAFVIAMQRKRPDEHTDDFDYTDSDGFARLRSQIARWAADNGEALAQATPETPAGFHNRTRANWRLPLAIAERCGGDWKAAAHKAAQEVEQVAAASDPEIGVQLLADIRAVFDRLGVDRLTTKILIGELCRDEEGPWLSYGRGGKPITDRQLSRLLKDFRRGYGIKSKSIRAPGIAGTPKGYVRNDFEDDFAAYLSPCGGETDFRSATPQQVNDTNDLFENGTATSTPHVADRLASNLLEKNNCCGVADRNGVSAETEENRAVEGAGDGPGEPPDLCAESMVEPDEDRSCRQCGGLLDGTERRFLIHGAQIWLHPECRRFWKAGPVGEDVPW